MTAAKPRTSVLSRRLALPDYRTWPGRPKCADASPEAFFPPPGDFRAAEAAKAICAACPVREHCFEAAMSMAGADDRYGIWAGYTARERGRLRQKQARKAAA